MSKVDKYLREGEKVLAEASIDKDYIDDRPLGWLYCKVVLCVMIALTLFTCLYIFVENPKMTAKGMPFNSSFFLMWALFLRCYSLYTLRRFGCAANWRFLVQL